MENLEEKEKPEIILSAKIKAALDAPIDNTSDSNEVKQRFSNSVAKAILEVCEALANKVFSISAESTDTEYPSAKAVYDALTTIASLHFEIVTTLPTEDIKTNVIYLVPAAKPSIYNQYDEYYYINKKWERLGGGDSGSSSEYEKVSNKVTTISALSTDEEYPSAKLLYDQLQLKADVNKVYTKEEVDDLIRQVQPIKFEIVSELPTEDISTNTIYLLTMDDPQLENAYYEYIYINETWELIGSTKVIDDEIVSSETTWSSEKLNAPYNWVIRKMQEELYDLAMEKYVVSTTAANDTYITDVVTSTTMTVTVALTFDGVAVDADSTPTGWTKESGVGIYTKTITGASGTVAATDFTYTPASGEFQGITVTKKSAEKKISAINPIFFGFATTNDQAQLASVIGTLIRQTTKKQSTGDLVNNTGAVAYYWILTKSTATATQLGSTILNAPIPNKSFISTQNSSITMTGYNLYISTLNCAAGGSITNVSLTINV